MLKWRQVHALAVLPIHGQENVTISDWVNGDDGKYGQAQFEERTMPTVTEHDLVSIANAPHENGLLVATGQVDLVQQAIEGR